MLINLTVSPSLFCALMFFPDEYQPHITRVTVIRYAIIYNFLNTIDMNIKASDANADNLVVSDTQQKKAAAASFKKLQPEEFYRHHIDKVICTREPIAFESWIRFLYFRIRLSINCSSNCFCFFLL